MDPLIGKRLREYLILELLGKGGMAKVYKARHVLLNEIRAVKFLRPELRERQECVARFHREAQIMVQLKSKHLVMLYEFGTVGHELLFLVMEYLEGETLRKRLRRTSWLPASEAIRIVQQVALGLQEAHKHRVVHRDISPDNIQLVHQNGEEIAKVIDFGIAKNLVASGGKITQTMKLVGKAEYVAPEQICLPVGEDGRDAVDHRADIYSLGVTFYELLAGAKPFEARTSKAYLVKHLTEPPKPLSETNPLIRISPAIEDLVLRMLAKKKEQRPDSMENLFMEHAALSHEEPLLTPV
ncbi:MAG: serine/threonine protein kinase [Vicinamibacteria bacterium]